MKQLDASLVSTASGSVDFDAHNIWNPMMELLFHMQIGGKLRSLSWRKRTWQESRFLVILPLICLVTRRGPMILLEALPGVLAPGGSLF